MKNLCFAAKFALIVFMALSQNVFAQTSEKGVVKDVTKQKRQTSVYAELLGTSVLYSLNIEERWQLNTKSQVGVRVGFSTFRGGFFSNIKRIYVPILLHYSWSMGSTNEHFIELGAGVQIADLQGWSSRGFFEERDTYAGTYVLPTASLHYRYQGPKGFMMRAGITPTFRYTSGLVGLSLGYTF